MSIAYDAPERHITSDLPALADPRRHDQLLRLTRLLQEASPERRERLLIDLNAHQAE